MQWRHASTSANHHTTLHNDNIFTHVNATVAIDHGCQSEFDMLRANMLIASIFTARLLHVYRVVQKNGATLHFPKYLENY